MKTPHFVQIHQPADEALALEAQAGLLREPAAVPPKFFYDALGSRLFDAITELQAYYPTRIEASILSDRAKAVGHAVREAVGPAPAMIDLGAGNCAKAARLFELLDPSTYVAVDISVDFLRQALLCLQREHPARAMVGLGMDFSAGFALPAGLPGLDGSPRLVFYPGSSIGNFTPDAACALLRDMRAVAAGGALLIGVDLVKSRSVLEEAYDDELGVTAAFNLNLLHNLNRLLGADFRIPDWQHVAFFNETDSRIEMHLQARRDVQVQWSQGARAFRAGERMHTENSYKWTPAGFMQLLRQAGFGQVQAWQDAAGWYGVFLASG